MNNFDIEKCTKYDIDITPAEWRNYPDEEEAWINPVDDALEGEGQWDGPFGQKFEEFLIEMSGGELQEGLWAFDEGTFDDEEAFIREAKSRGFDVTIRHSNVED